MRKELSACISDKFFFSFSSSSSSSFSSPASFVFSVFVFARCSF